MEWKLFCIRIVIVEQNNVEQNVEQYEGHILNFPLFFIDSYRKKGFGFIRGYRWKKVWSWNGNYFSTDVIVDEKRTRI